MGLIRTILFGLVIFFIVRFIMKLTSMVRGIDPPRRRSERERDDHAVDADFEEIDSRPMK